MNGSNQYQTHDPAGVTWEERLLNMPLCTFDNYGVYRGKTRSSTADAPHPGGIGESE